MTNRFATAICACALASLAMVGVVRAQDPVNHWPPQKLAAAIETQAQRTSFAQLEAFGRKAATMPGRAGLDRVEHVAWVMLNQSEFDRFKVWNDLLVHRAKAEGDKRYLAIARVNVLRSRYDQADASAGPLIMAAAAETDGDWMARMHAMSTAAYVLIREGETGEALKMLFDADALAPRADPWVGSARAGVWEIEGLALMDLQDLGGSALAFGRSQFEFAPRDYPRPDFDGLYNLTNLAVKLGREDLAQPLYAAHHRLTLRSDLPNLGVWDRNLCAMVAGGAGQSQQVLDCLNSLGADLGPASFLAPQLLPSRAIANARLGHLAEARRDLDKLERLRASKAFSEAAFSRLPLVRAEVLKAEGRTDEAFQALRNYSDLRAAQDGRRLGTGIGQLTTIMEHQLGVRREQLATARRNADLQRTVIRAQELIVAGSTLIVVIIIGALVWQARVARQLRHARRNADMANQAKSEFLANMSHEIRTPLNGVVAVADMLARADLQPREKEMVEIIRSSGDTLQRLLSDILDLARVESGRLAIEVAPFQAGAVVRAVAALSQLRCDEKGVQLQVEVDPGIDELVLGDQVRVRQVLTNFLSNAVKFTDCGRIRITAERTAAGVARFTVTDTGVGFEPVSKSRVLGRFQQADASITRRFGGTGLGMSISRELAQLMGGFVDCDSTPGVGSRFWLEIPLPSAEREESPASAEAGPPALAGKLRVLLADDHPTNRKVVELMLAGGEVELEMVENGRQALDAVFAEPGFDLVLMDMQMPVMDGLTAVREIRRREAAGGATPVPVIMLTANALPEHIAQAQAAGADLHLSKPFTAAMLFEAMAAVTGDETEAVAAA